MAEILRESCDNLRNDKTNGAPTLATNALSYLLKINRSKALTECSTSKQYVSRLLFSAYALTEARPSMRSAITNALISSLSEATARHPLIVSTRYLTGKQDQELLNKFRPDVERIIQENLSNRSQRSELAEAFYQHFMENNDKVHDQENPSLLTLSSSGTVSQCLIHAANKLLPQHSMKVYVLESRPAFE